MLDFRKIEEIRKEIDKDVRLSQNKFAVQSWIKYTSYQWEADLSRIDKSR